MSSKTYMYILFLFLHIIDSSSTQNIVSYELHPFVLIVIVNYLVHLTPSIVNLLLQLCSMKRILLPHQTNIKTHQCKIFIGNQVCIGNEVCIFSIDAVLFCLVLLFPAALSALCLSLMAGSINGKTGQACSSHHQ